jgi:hypothetical protein
MTPETQSDLIHRQWSSLFLIFSGQVIADTAENRADKFSLPRGIIGRPGSFAPERLVHSHPANTHVMH